MQGGGSPARVGNIEGWTMEIIGKEYKKKFVNSKVEVTHFVKVKCSMKTDLTKFIWGKRKCFMCGGKFKDSDNPVAAITKRGMNKIICEKCYLSLPEDKK